MRRRTVVIGGLLSSTLLTMVVLPVLFSVMASVRDEQTAGENPA